MKKLVLWLSLVLAIGLSAQSAWAAETPAQLWVSYDASDGNGWQWNQPMTKDADGSFSFVFPQVDENKLFFAITRVNNLSDDSWAGTNDNHGFNVQKVQYTFGTWDSAADHEPNSGQVLEVYGNCYHVLKISQAGMFKIKMTPTTGENEGYTKMRYDLTKVETPSELWVSYDSGRGWQWNKPMTKKADGSFSFTFPNVSANKLFFAITRVGDLSDSSWATGGGFKDQKVQYSFGTWNAIAALQPDADGQLMHVYGNCYHVLKIDDAGTFTITMTPTAGESEGYVNMNYTCTKETGSQGVPAYVNMPLKPIDFEGGKKHYFLIGSRQGDWRLQPEWEFTEKNGNTLTIDGARVLYTGAVEIGVVDNYFDYVHQRYTRWGGATKSSMNLNDRTIYNLVNRGSFDVYASDIEAAGHQADHFCASENHNYNYDAIKNSKGAVATAVTLTLSGENGNPVSWSITIPDNSPAKALSEVTNYITLSLVGDAVVNRGLPNADFTPTGSSVWESAWVQFGAQGQPYRDAYNNLMFQTVFQPAWLDLHPSIFQKNITRPDGSTYTFDFSSRNIAMKNVKRMTDDELALDPYAPLYKRFENDPDKHIGGRTVSVAGNGDHSDGFKFTEKIVSYGKGAATNTPRECDNWRCYVVKDMWVSGEFKIWTGWGGGQKKHEGITVDKTDRDNARWYYLNGGHAEAHKVHDIQGYDITGDNAEVTVFGTTRDVDGANFNIPNLTYYKRVIVWAGNDDFNGSVIQLITELCGPNIKAMRGQTGSEIDLAWNIPGDDLSEEELKMGLKTYEILRYIYDNDGNLVLKGSMGEKDITGKTVGDVVPEQTKETEPSLNDTGLNSNTYKYKIILTFADGKKREAWSNDVTIYDASAPVIARSFQRMEDHDTKYSFDAMLNTMISAAALSQEYDGIPTRNLVDGYLIKVGETMMTDLNSSDLYINGVKTDRKFETATDKEVWQGGIKRQMSGYFMEVLFNDPEIPVLDNEDPSRREFKWENVAKQEPGADYAYEIFIIPNESYLNEFASAQFESTSTHFLMVVPNTVITWNDKGIASRTLEADTDADAMPMGTHCGTDLYHPINYTRVNYLYAHASLSELPVTQSVKDGFDIAVLASGNPELTAADAIDPEQGLTLTDIDFAYLTRKAPEFPCERELVVYNGGAAMINATAFAKASYVRRSDNRTIVMPAVSAHTAIEMTGLKAPSFQPESMRINGYFKQTADNSKYSVHNLYMDLRLDDATPLALTDGLFYTAGYYVTADASDFATPAELVTDAKGAKGGIVAHTSNRNHFVIDDLAGYEPYQASNVFDQKNNWAEKAVENGHLPVIVNAYAAKAGNTEMTSAEMPAAKATVTYHYPFMSGKSMLTLTEGTTKTVSLAGVEVPTAINEINADNNGQVVYYNLQGIKIDAPVKGQIYLAVGPDGVAKVIF